MRRIGIMGGTFNPIHNGHLAIAGRAKEQFSLRKVLFMPSGVPYMKDQREVLPIQTRCEMTSLAIRDLPGFELSRLEAADAALGKNTYTCNTLQKLRCDAPEISYYFILGADSLYAMEDWKNPELIFQNCTVLAAVRTGEPSTDAKFRQSFAGRADRGKTDGDFDRALLPERLLHQAQYLREKYGASIEILEFAGMDISSTQIRERVRRRESLQGLVPEAVETYIRENRLYEKES
ncbi:MAG: nicotinate-nucleotide adenylyltransferase [Lachnospiraceae bacterium]|nr:nicotinate-nucleotide adenylyltransferase [Lachnospiraceae bacterium]